MRKITIKVPEVNVIEVPIYVIVKPNCIQPSKSTVYLCTVKPPQRGDELVFVAPLSTYDQSVIFGPATYVPYDFSRILNDIT